MSVKPHASPVLHAINYLLGELTASTYDAAPVRRAAELSQPDQGPRRRRLLDRLGGHRRDRTDLGRVARRYVDAHSATAGAGRQYSLLGDAELDEGACWEAVLDPMVAELGEVVWIVDLNRQSSTGSSRTSAPTRLQGMFAAAGWQVLTVKYGRLLEELFARPGGEALRRRIDAMSNPEYQRLLRRTPEELRDALPGDGPDGRSIRG